MEVSVGGSVPDFVFKMETFEAKCKAYDAEVSLEGAKLMDSQAPAPVQI